MIKPAIPDNEKERIAAFEAYNLWVELEHKEFKEIVSMAAYVCDTPISMISLVASEKQRFIGRIGLKEEYTSRDVSFCAHAINNPHEPLLVEDARKDERFSGNPLVQGDPNIVFYAGFPLVTPDEYALGTLCVIDSKPKKLNAEQIRILTMLSNQVIRLFQLRKTVKNLEQNQERLEETVTSLEEYTSIIAHDLKTSLRSIEIASELLQKKNKDMVDTQCKEYFETIQNEIGDSMVFINGMLKFAQSVHTFQQDKSLVDMAKLMPTIISKLPAPSTIEITSASNLPTLYTSRTAIQHIFEHLIQNSIKFIDKEKDHPSIHIKYKSKAKYHVFKVVDNGIGIEKNRQAAIFNLFAKKENESEDINEIGVGLVIVNRLVNLLGGKTKVKSSVGKGATFVIKIPKEVA